MQAYTKQVAVGCFEFGRVVIRLLEQSRFISSGMLHLEITYIRGHVDGMSLK